MNNAADPDIHMFQQLFARTSTAASPEEYAKRAQPPPPPPRKKPRGAHPTIALLESSIDLTGDDARMDTSPTPPSGPPPTNGLSVPSAPSVPMFPIEVLNEINEAKRTEEILSRLSVQIPQALPPSPAVAPPSAVALQPSPTTIMDETKASFPLATPEMKDWYSKQCEALMKSYSSVAALPLNMNNVAAELQSARHGVRLLSELAHGLQQRGRKIANAIADLESAVGPWITQQYLFLRCKFPKRKKEDKGAPFALLMLHRPYAEGEDRIQTQHYRALCALADCCGPDLKGIIYVNASEPYRPALCFETHRPDMDFIVDRLDYVMEEWTSTVWPTNPLRHTSCVAPEKRMPVCRVAYICASMRPDGHVALLNQSSVFVPEYPPCFIDVVYTAG
jgi:hypothetical protein